MRIAIDASRTTVARVTGTEHYARQMIRALTALPSDHTFTLYFRDPPPDGLFPDVTPEQMRVIPLPRAWTHVRFAAALTADRPDLTWVPAHTLPFLFPGRALVTVHDLGYRHFPDAHPIAQRLYLDLTTRTSATRATHILADSRATATDLRRFYGVKAEKISVVYPGVDALAIGDVAEVRRRYRLPERYLLFLGTLQPRKNIARIVEAYKRAAIPGVGLVLAGGRGWLFDESWVAGVEGMIMPGFIDDADKGALYAGASAFVFPSLYEGFGFPVLEAMQCGTPVIASSTSSLPELTADAALSVDPHDSEAIAVAMRRVIADAELRARLIAAGKTRAAAFTWEAAARALLRLIDDLKSD